MFSIRFMQHYVTDGKVKARVHYSATTSFDGRPCVTLYARDYGGGLGLIFPSRYVNDTDSSTDYFDQGRVHIFPGNPLYVAARDRAGLNAILRLKRHNNRAAKKAGVTL